MQSIEQGPVTQNRRFPGVVQRLGCNGLCAKKGKGFLVK